MNSLSPEKKAALQSLLAKLPEAAQAHLFSVFEREQVAAASTDVARGVLGTMRESGVVGKLTPTRQMTPERAFFEPIDTIFETAVDGALLPGSFDRAHIRPIWMWMRNNIVRDVLEQAEGDIRQESLRGNQFGVTHAAETLRDFGVTALMRLYDPEHRVLARDEGLSDAELASAIRLGDVLIAEREAREALRTLSAGSNDLTDAHVAPLHNAYRPLAARKDNSGTALLILIMTRLRRPWHIFRLVRRIHPTGGDRVLDNTDFAVFGTRLLMQLDRIAAPVLATRRGGVIASETLIPAVENINAFVVGFMREFEADREGPWGKRLSETRRNVANALEALADRAASLIDNALPVVRSRVKSVGVIDHPRLTSQPKAEDVEICANLIRFIVGTRLTAAAAGFGAAREKALKDVSAHLSKFQDGVLAQIQNSETRQLALGWVPHIESLTEALEGQEAARVFQRRAKAA